MITGSELVSCREQAPSVGFMQAAFTNGHCLAAESAKPTGSPGV